MNKYIKLVKNISIFAIGTFTSKLLVFFLTPFYTSVLSRTEYGILNNVIDTATLLIPIASLSITDAVIRFGLDRSVNRSQVFTNGLIVVFSGFGVLLLFIPVILQINLISDYTLLIYLYVLCSSLNSLCLQFVRAKGMVKLFAYSGIQNTVIMVIANIFMLGIFNLGINGYILSIIIADLLSALFLFWVAGLKRYINFKRINKALFRAMLVFSLPLIPSTLFWWINNASDKYMLSSMLPSGEEITGLYSVANKLPSIISMVAGIVMQAWNISAITEDNAADKKRFYKNVFGTLSSTIFIGSSLVIVLSKVITRVLASEAFYDAWQFVPLLMLAIIFTCFSSFLASVYMVAKRNKISMLTIMAGAIVNVVLNLILIPSYGGLGAATATFSSCLLVFVLRVITTKQFIRFDMQIPKITLNTIILLFQAVVMILEVRYWLYLEIIFFALVLIINSGTLLKGAKNVLTMRKNR